MWNKNSLVENTLSSKVEEDSEALIKEEQELDEEDERIYEQRYSTELDMNAKQEKMEDDVYNLKKVGQNGGQRWNNISLSQFFNYKVSKHHKNGKFTEVGANNGWLFI